MEQQHPSPIPDPQRKPLVTVEFQQEVDISTGTGESRMFVKMYFDARDSGLLREMPADLWQLLCCLSTYMDPAGNCFPSQERIARDLGMARETVNRKLRKLLAWRFNGKPVIRVTRKIRNGRTQQWATNRYEILPISSLGIFDSTPFAAKDRHVTESSHGLHVTNLSHGDRHTESDDDRHTNKIKYLNKKTFDVERDSNSCSDELGEDDGPQPDPADASIAHREHGMARRTLEQRQPPTSWVDEGLKPIRDSFLGVLATMEREELSDGEVQDLVSRIEDATGDRHSRRRFQAIAQRVPKHVIERLLGTIKSAGTDLRNSGAFFEKSIQIECRALEIDLPRARPERPPAAGSQPSDPALSTGRIE